MARQLVELKWVEELLPSIHIRKPMFGGFAYYINNKLILVLFENNGDRKYKNKIYDFDLWNGCMFPCEREFHNSIKNKFSFLINHPVLPKWLYLPLDTENFEEHLKKVFRDIKHEQTVFGVIPKSKHKTTAKIKNSKINLTKPRMFSDDTFEDKVDSFKKISDLKNFGPATEATFHKAGIKTVAQFIKLGWKKSFTKLVKSNPKNRHSIFAYALIGALQNKEWHQISHAQKDEARQFTASLKKSKK